MSNVNANTPSYYAICTGKNGNYFTLRHFYPYFNSYRGWEMRDSYIMTLKQDLEESKAKAIAKGYTAFQIHAVATAGIKRNAINHEVMPFGRNQGKHYTELSLDELVRLLNGGFIDGTRYVKFKAFVVAHVRANGCTQVTHEWDENVDSGDGRGLRVVHVTKTLWYTPAGLAAYQAAKQAKDAANQARKNSTHVGTVGQKITCDVTVVFVSCFTTNFRTSYIVKMEDANYNTLVYFGNVLANKQQGSKFSLTFTVKGHDDYKGQKQTSISHPKINA